ncbi:MAG: SDR family NAD(P)-dependent oxidoreductase, partial [Clostridia bacterium]|nr:SDR family NAD(P)-dependent oxidoreductase [Clostridia bacterium]
MAALIAVLAANLDWTLKILWWYLGNLALSYVFLILFRMYYFTFDTVGLIDTLKLVGVAVLTFATGCSYSPFLVGIWPQFVYTITFFSFVLAIRYSKRIYIMIKYSVTSRNRGKIRAMIIGGGNAGATLIREIQTTDKIDYNPVCVIDDDVSKTGKRIGNVKIVGTTEDIKKCAEKYAIEEILIAIPSATKAEVKRIYEICKTTDCKVKTLPGIYQIVSGEASVAALREVQITDLLGREQIQVNLDEIMGYIEGQVVLVTGGGGSIGSELCRQIATHNPKQLIILDIYENNAYDIEQELKRKHPSLNLLALIASIRDKGKMEDVFTKYHPDIVFNAAAHKHVPLMETSPNEAVKNNVFGTLNVARCSDKFGVKVFVQISTDKAVNPTNIMGATKRICE